VLEGQESLTGSVGDKVDVCIRSLSLRRTFASTAEDRRELASWLCRNKVGKTVMEASGGYEREWAKALRVAKIEVSDRRSEASSQLRSIDRTAGQERHDRCRDDCLVCRDLRPNSEPGLRCDARAASPDGPRVPGIEGHAIQADKPGRACATGCGAADSRPDILLPLVGEPSRAAIAATNKCIAMAGNIGARVTAAAAGAVRSVSSADDLLQAFEAAAIRFGVPNEQRIYRLAPADIPANLAICARLKDLSIVPVKPHDDQSEKIVEGLIFESGVRFRAYWTRHRRAGGSRSSAPPSR
jgi:hypothetical protein